MYTKHTFKNDLRLITAPMKETETVTVLVMVGVGSKYETKNINGISHFLEHMFFKGTKKRPNKQKIAETLDKIGGEYNAFTSKEVTAYYAKVDKAHLDLALDFVSDIFLNSKIEAREIEKEKGVIVEELNMYQDAPMKYVSILFEKLLYGNQPAGWLVGGEKNIIKSFKRSDFMSYLKNYYSAHNTVVCVSGNIDDATVKNKINKYFVKINTQKPQGKEKVREEQSDSQALLHYKKTDQTHFCLGVRALDTFHPLRFAQHILANILGGNMSSRLFIEVREKRGLAYYVSTHADEYTDSGYIVTQVGVDNKKVELAISVIMREYKKIQEKGITVAELQKAKDYMKGKISLRLESSDDIANFLVNQEVLENKIKTPKEIIEELNKITIEDIRKISKTIFRPENLNLALIGPFKDKEKFQKLLKL